ncbi:Nucleoside transporter [Ceratobasidium sp. AG-Ba]|nr:Nucleoside transporter [Ceratobasidium sp. AG-Ba]QRW01454.1 Nucleoside transporter [Ceratobasidium sp. AG-Ba]
MSDTELLWFQVSASPGRPRDSQEGESSTANIPNNNSDDDLMLPRHVEPHAPLGVRLSFGIIGISALMPWNAMITAMPYFLARLGGSPFASSFASWLSVTWTLMGFASLGIATITAENNIPAVRIVLPLACNTLLISFLATTPHIPLAPALLFSLALANGACQAILGSFLQTSVVALASVFGPDAIASYMTGGALVAVGVSLLKLSTAYASLADYSLNILEIHGGTAARGATTYFCLAAVFVSLGIFAYAYLYPRIPVDLLKSDTPEHQVDSGAESDEPSEVDYLLGRVSRTPIPMSTASIWIVARKNACYNIAVFYVFVVTLALFPAITTSITSILLGARSQV